VMFKCTRSLVASLLSVPPCTARPVIRGVRAAAVEASLYPPCLCRPVMFCISTWVDRAPMAGTMAVGTLLTAAEEARRTSVVLPMS
jgi:hypothetical protein